MRTHCRMMGKIKGLKSPMFCFNHPHKNGLFSLRKGHYHITPIRQISVKVGMTLEFPLQKLHGLRSSSFWHLHGSLTLVHLDRYHEVKPNGICFKKTLRKRVVFLFWKNLRHKRDPSDAIWGRKTVGKTPKSASPIVWIEWFLVYPNVLNMIFLWYNFGPKFFGT